MSGLTPAERAVMDRWDEGMSYQQIADAIGKTPHQVRKIVSYYHDAGDETAERTAMRSCSTCFLEALRAA